MNNRPIIYRVLLAMLLMLPAGLQAAEEFVTLDDGNAIKVFMFYPREHGDGPWPLCVIMSGGTANEYIARAQFYLGKELADRGWAIAVPVSPDARPFFGENAEKIPKVIAELKKSPDIRSGKTLLVGVSNGGSSALEIAANDPEDYMGVVAVPGIIKDSTELGALNGLPVYIRIGGRDQLRWYRHLPTISKRLQEAGAQVNAAVIPDANHVFPLNWNELQPWLDSLPQE